MGKPSIWVKDYELWWDQCYKRCELNGNVETLIPQERRAEFGGKEEWLRRRSLDLMLYRLSPKQERR